MFNKKKIAAWIISIIVGTSIVLSSCNSGTSGSGGNKTLVIGTAAFNGVFNPFLASTAYDNYVVNLTNAMLIGNTPSGEPVDGIATYVPPKEIKGDDGKTTKTIYTFALKNDVKFSDGTAVTADDIIFTYKVLLDPTYTGPSSLRSTPIVGLNEYFYDDKDYKASIDKILVSSKNISDEDTTKYLAKMSDDSFIKEGAEKMSIRLSFENKDNLSGDSLKKALIEANINDLKSNNKETMTKIFQSMKYKDLEKEYISSNLSSSTVNVSEIEGIKKIDERTVEITIEGVDPKAIWNLGDIEVASQNYYGVGKSGGKFSGDKYSKGKMDIISEKNDSPMGAGPYKFVEYKNNVVSFVANSHYYGGLPHIEKLKLQVVDDKNKIPSIAAGNIDVSDPSGNPASLKQAQDAGLETITIDNLGYGYIGMNAERIPDKNVRKGLMHLMNRAPAVQSFYGDLASVIEYPMSRISWAYPENAKPVYDFSSIKAMEYFTKAGYKKVEQNGKTILQKDGVQLKIEVGIGGSGTMDHPAGPIITQLKNELESLGGKIDIQDVDANILFDRLSAGQWDMWVAAWQSVIDPDMFQLYHSKGTTNHYKIQNDKLDDLITKARETNDISIRKTYYIDALNIIMDEAVEMPVYQRKNMYVFNQKILDKDSIPSDHSPFRFPFTRGFYDIEKLKLVK
ncbi:MAG: ABC transporter substrate-binding protein [Oscillospiraceae bacterium]|nr:ABC transporter substrate-binding protein [Oscillospiraceae bacterium]